jgi:aminoglycoside 6'-N-acetyltransferase I
MVLAGSGMGEFFAGFPCPSIQCHAPWTLYAGVPRLIRCARMTARNFIERCSSLDQQGWLEFRRSLWPDATADEHRGYMAIALAQPERFLQLMMYSGDRVPIGLIEGSIRADYVNGTETSPVGFVEGVYVAPEWRRKGIARQLFESIGDWARARGCRELASDALLENVASQRAHAALGFRETERVVYFVKSL